MGGSRALDASQNQHRLHSELSYKRLERGTFAWPDPAEDAPVLCLLDDAQWLDQATIDAGLVATRRLDADRVAVVFASRDGEGHAFAPDGVPAVGDTGSTESVRSMVETAARELGGIDILVNCAAATDRGTIESTTEEIWDRLFTLNVKPQCFLVQP